MQEKKGQNRKKKEKGCVERNVRSFIYLRLSTISMSRQATVRVKNEWSRNGKDRKHHSTPWHRNTGANIVFLASLTAARLASSRETCVDFSSYQVNWRLVVTAFRLSRTWIVNILKKSSIDSQRNQVEEEYIYIFVKISCHNKLSKKSFYLEIGLN